MDVLELPPETLLYIGGFLEGKNLFNCIRVCKSWNALFVPVLFRTIEDTHRQPPVEVLARHGQHVRKLKFSTGSPLQSKTSLSTYADSHSPCRNIQELDIAFDFRRLNMDQDRQSAKDLILSNRNLQKLWIEELEQHERKLRTCWSQVLSGCNRSLKVLSLTNVWLSAEDVSQLWELAPTLQKLKLEMGISAWSGSFAANPQFPQLTSLFLRDALPTVVQELEWIKQCPNLRTLDWSASKDRLVATQQAFKNFGAHQWSHLQDINLWGDTIWTDSQVSCLLRSCGPLKSLRLNNSSFWYRTLDALERHFGTLETLHLRRISDLQGWMIQWIMSSCPKLKVMVSELFPAQEFVEGEEAEKDRRHCAKLDEASDTVLARFEGHGGDIETTEKLEALMARFASVRDHAHARPWVCLELEHLQGNISIPSAAGKDWDQAVFRRLSKLKKLKHLVLSEEFGTTVPGSRAVRADLRSGLGELASVRYLESLMFDGSAQCMEREDVQWILDQWPKLKDLSSDFNIDPAISFQLQSMVQKTSRDIFMTTVFDTDLDASNGDWSTSSYDSDTDASDRGGSVAKEEI